LLRGGAVCFAGVRSLRLVSGGSEGALQVGSGVTDDVFHGWNGCHL
jgi:hypothetical protein